MSAKSEKQKKMMAVAVHNPSKINKENADVKKMSKKELREFTFKPKDMLKEKKKKKEPFINLKVRERNKALDDIERFQSGK